MNHPKRILIVDVEEIIRDLLESRVETLGYETEMARDGLEALAMMKLDVLDGKRDRLQDHFENHQPTGFFP